MEKKEYDVRDLFLKEDLVAIAKRSRENSCSGEKARVSGEYYVTNNKQKRKKINVSKMKVAVLAGATVALLALGSKIVGDNDFATDIRHEVTRTQNVFNPIGGSYETEYVYGQDFVDHISELSDKELSDLYDQTVSDMRGDGLLEESNVQSEVVSNMQHDYEESFGHSAK